MCRLLETIRVLEGQPLHLEFHHQRVNRTRRELFGLDTNLPLEQIRIPRECTIGTWKLRVVYDTEIRSVVWEPYVRRMVKSVKVVTADDLDYGFKYEDRSRLEELALQKAGCDDILILRKGLVTDTSYANVAFLDPEGHWITPDRPLLPGTCRARLLAKGNLQEARITSSDIRAFKSMTLLNAMLDPGEVILDVRMIRK